MIEEEKDVNENDVGHEILDCDTERVLRDMKGKKGRGVDKILF